ncbi:MAG: oligosaccharide flippase family protein [Nitrososphaerota archaeon]|nr:oligosaccharide flippase family protein [Candidatus Nezhaarchaeota archaeon]MDW8050016.1 oligosaccharide flippase family protein [Nitrososphaerota archaeon]
MSSSSASVDRSRFLMSVVGEVIGGSFHLFWGGVLATALSAICGITIASLLGPELYGIYSLTFVVPGFLMLLTDYGVSRALTRFIALHMSRGESGKVVRLLRASLTFSLVISFVIFTMGLVFVKQLTSLLINRPEMAHLVAMMLILALAQPISTVAGSTLLGFGEIKKYAMIDVVRQAFRAVLGPMLLIMGFGILGAVVGNVLAYIAGAALSLVLVYHCYRQIKEDYWKAGTSFEGGSRGVLVSMMSYGFPLHLTGVLYSFILTFRGIVLAHFVANELIGNFGVALNLAVLITLISTPVATSLFPGFSKLGYGDEAKTMFTLSVKYASMLIVPSVVFVAAMSRSLVHALFGESYHYAPLYLSTYVMIYLLAGLGSTVLDSFFAGIGDSTMNLKIAILHAVLFAALSVPLTANLKVEGLLIAIIIATGVSVLYGLRCAIKKYNVKVDFNASSRVYFASLIAVTPIIPVSLYSPLPSIINLAMCASVYLVAYLTVAPILGVLTSWDLENLTRMYSKITIIRPLVKAISRYEYKIIRLMGSRGQDL